MAKAKAPGKYLTLREIARDTGRPYETLKEWVQKGEYPEPHAVIATTWLYKRAVVEYFDQHGRWPEGVRFRHARA
jgi:hypothetical protein